MTRQLQVEYLRQYYDVQVITINQQSSSIETEGYIHRIPDLNKFRWIRYLEKFGLVEDTLYQWMKTAFSYLKDLVKEGDIIFATTGGEIACLKLGYLLKTHKPGAKFIINYHDLLDYGYYEGERVYNDFHVRIDDLEKHYAEKADWLLANSEIMKDILADKFVFMKERIDYVYFGYKPADLSGNSRKGNKEKIIIVYIGVMGALQSPETLLLAYRKLPPAYKQKFELIYVGDYSVNRIIAEAQDARKINYLPREKMLEVLMNEADLAYLPLIEKYAFRSFMGTKLYEFIGLEIPVLGHLPKDCEAERVINKEGFGITTIFGDEEALVRALQSIADNPERLEQFRQNIKQRKQKYDSSQTLKKMKKIIDDMLIPKT